MENYQATEAGLQAEIEVLRVQYPQTQDLYREVCIVLFFRHGITPTANKLYQLVRKGSMSAPADALIKFWKTMREKSRTRIEHPDLPETLRDAAGEMVGALWQRAQGAAQDAVGQLQKEARAQVLIAEGVAQTAAGRVQEIELSLNATQQAQEAIQQRWMDSQADLARTQGEVASLQSQIGADVAQRRALQEGFNLAQQRFTDELDQQRTAALTVTERHATEAKRLLLEVDRERGNASKLQKSLEQAQRLFAEQTELQRQQTVQKQQEFEALRQRNGELEGSVAELRGQRDQLLKDTDGLRLRLENPPIEKKVQVERVKRTIRPIAKTTRVRRSL